MSELEIPLVVSSDVRRDERIPPRQAETPSGRCSTPAKRRLPRPVKMDLPRLRAGRKPWQYTYAEFTALPRIRVHADMHCVAWSKLDNTWEGVGTREVLAKVKVDPRAKFVMVHCEHGFTTNLPLEDPRRGLPVRVEAQRAGSGAGPRLAAAAGGAAAVRLEERQVGPRG
jgi:hypothetical protein